MMSVLSGSIIRAVQHLYTVTLLVIALTAVAVNTMEDCPVNITNNNNDTLNYKYQINVNTDDPYTPSQAIEINLIIADVCLKDYNQSIMYGPSWYKIEAIYEDSNEPAMGKFEIPINFKEAYLYKETIIIFKTNYPSLLDLIGKYRWRPSLDALCDEENKRPVCFRATVHHHQSNSCEISTVCVPPTNESYATDHCKREPVTPQPAVTQPSPSPPSPELLQKCMKKWHCKNAKMKTFCGTNGINYPSRCHWRRALCLAKLTSSDFTITKGSCALTSTIPEPTSTSTSSTLTNTPTPTPPPVWPPKPVSTLCLTYRRISPEGWKAECMINGEAKRIQCDRELDGLHCWCSGPDSAELKNTRHLIANCDDIKKMTCLVFHS